MKRLAMTAVVAASVGLTGCATNPYGSQYGYNDPNMNQQAGRTAAGVAAGAIGGAAAGAIIPGVSTTTGAIAGAVLGGVLGSVIKGRQYYRATNGYCYYVDQNGQARYDYNVRC